MKRVVADNFAWMIWKRFYQREWLELWSDSDAFNKSSQKGKELMVAAQNNIRIQIESACKKCFDTASVFELMWGNWEKIVTDVFSEAINLFDLSGWLNKLWFNYKQEELKKEFETLLDKSIKSNNSTELIRLQNLINDDVFKNFVDYVVNLQSDSNISMEKIYWFIDRKIIQARFPVRPVKRSKTNLI